MKNSIIASTFLLLFFGMSAYGQCPRLELSASSSDIQPGKPITFSVHLSGGNPNDGPTYNWSVSASYISSGQGTSTITIEETAELGGQSLTATVEVGGLSPECDRTRSATVSIVEAPKANKIDEYVVSNWKNERPRVDNVAISFANDPLSGLHVIYYESRTSKGSGKKAGNQALAYLKTHLSKNLNTPAGRVELINGGYREDVMLEYWIFPEGAEPPLPTPTIPASEINKPKPKPKSSGGKKS